MVVSVTLAAITARVHTLLPVILTVCACYMLGYIGLLLTPAVVPWLWALLLGTGGGAFPIALIMIGLRSRTGQGSSALSGFVQGVGYFAAAGGPFLVGVLRESTGSWNPPLALLLASTVALLLFGIGISRVRYVEDEVAGK